MNNLGFNGFIMIQVTVKRGGQFHLDPHAGYEQMRLKMEVKSLFSDPILQEICVW